MNRLPGHPTVPLSPWAPWPRSSKRASLLAQQESMHRVRGLVTGVFAQNSL